MNVSGGELEYDEDLVWQRVQDDLGPNVSPPNVVVQEVAGPGRIEGGLVYVDPVATSPDGADTLAHEFAHYVQRQQSPWPHRFVDSVDEGFAKMAFKEGFATVAQERYAAEYGYQTQWDGELATSSPELHWFQARYELGREYVAYRKNHTAELGSVLDGRWPRTSEQVLHPERGYEPAKPLDVAVAAANREGRTDYVPLRQPRHLGELAVRVTLWTRLDPVTATGGAEGWGNDTLLTFQGPDGTGHAWVVRFDTAADASDARTAFRAYHESDRRAFESPSEFIEGKAPPDRLVDGFWRATGDRGFRTVVVDDETLVVFAGPEPFVDAAAATGTAGNVTVGTGANATAT